tara:strand:- start:6 stop:1259 length:1254 start_codon:yes stop_codon:yes gene_type:complete
MADYPRITGTIAPTPRNRVSGFLADLLELGAKGYDVGSTLQAGGPITEGRLSTPVSDLLGIPELQRTLNRVSYNEPLTTGTGYTTRLRPDTVSAAMTVAPMVGPAAKAGAAGARMTGTALKDLATSDVAYNAAMNAMRRSGGMAELTAYHGTPHRFAPTEANPLGEFRSSQIGTGEGSQAYGHGLYVAEAPGTAKSYQIELARDPRNSVNKVISRLSKGANSDDVMFELRKHSDLADYQNDSRLKNDILKIIQHTNADGTVENEAIRAYNRTNSYLPPAEKGSFYHVDLPDPMIEKMLHWDKPLSEQPKNVQNAISKLLKRNFEEAKRSDPTWGNLGKPYDPLSMTGEEVMGNLYSLFGRESANPMRGSAAASEALRNAGIPGVQYFDATSRRAGKGTRNFVVFPGEEKNLTILKRE